jgi:hypothetical protein
VITHPCELRPRDVRLGRRQLLADRLHRFTNLQQPDPDGVAVEVVRKRTARDTGTDGLDGRHDVIEAIAAAIGSQRDQVPLDLRANSGHQTSIGHEVNSTPRISSSSAWILWIVNRPVRGAKSTRMSTSLPWWSSPRTTLPKMRALLTQCPRSTSCSSPAEQPRDVRSGR